ncbi:MAG: prephenate dehydratase [Myxococcales bacterium]|nr:prephenate dehydratase [Myxococcales bacterium]
MSQMTYFLGPDGTFCHAAAVAYFGTDTTLSPSPSIEALFEDLSGDVDAVGIVPVENSIEGSVNPTLDALLRHRELQFVGEVEIPIEQCLMSAGALDDVQVVHSHPHALAQCRQWLRANLPGAAQVSRSSTAAAAHAAVGNPSTAAVASAFAASRAGLRVHGQGIQDNSHNVTRFAVVGRSATIATGRDRTSVVLGAPHEGGALVHMLTVFDKAGISLSKIESRPREGQGWQYVFYVDLEGHMSDAPVAEALAVLRERRQLVRLLGSYPRCL